MFPGSTTDEQLNLIFQKLGTPCPEVNPALCALAAFGNGRFRTHSPKALLNPPRITPERADLLHKLLKARKGSIERGGPNRSVQIKESWEWVWVIGENRSD